MQDQKDFRYQLVKPMLDAGNVEKFSDIFKFIPKTVVAHDVGVDIAKWNKAIKNFDQFKLVHLFKVAELCEITEKDILNLVVVERELNKRSKL